MTEAPWRDAETLSELYHDDGLSIREVAEELDCSKFTVNNWMEKLGVDRRDRIEAVTRAVRRRPAVFRTDERGYEVWRTEDDGHNRKVKVHRLLAVAEHGVEALDGTVVHHKNEIPWDNRPENLELMTAEEHIREHKPSKGWV